MNGLVDINDMGGKKEEEGNENIFMPTQEEEKGQHYSFQVLFVFLSS